MQNDTYDRAGQLTNEVLFTNGLAGFTTNAWQYDEAGNWLHSPGENRWRLYNPDNELAGICGSNAPVSVTTAVTGHVEPGPGNNKWFNTWATVRGQTARVGTNTGDFTITNVPVYAGDNDLQVTVRDVSGNTAMRTRSVGRPMDETFRYDGNGNLTNWVSGTTNWVYEWDWADRLSKVTSNGITVLENWYDAGSRRLAKKDAAYALYILDGWESLAVLNQSGVAQEIFTRGIGLAGDIGTLVGVTKVSTPAIYYAHHNHRGDVTTVRYGTTTTATYGYSAYGNLVAQTGTDVCRFKFSSKERESSCGWSYYGYRFYAPQWQRWGAKDPYAEYLLLANNKSSATYVYHRTSNLYIFSNNSVIYLDPNGLHPIAIGIRIVWPHIGRLIGLLASGIGALIGVKSCEGKEEICTKVSESEQDEIGDPYEFDGNYMPPMKICNYRCPSIGLIKRFQPPGTSCPNTVLQPEP